MDKRINDQVRFLLEIDKVKGILRQSVILGDVNHREDDAEHSWHMSMCALILKEYFDQGPVDMERVLKMIMIHDIVEVYAGDVPAYSQYSQKEKQEKEMKSAEKIFSMLPLEQKNDLMNMWLEFDEVQTTDAKFANVFDRFQGFMQNITSDGHTWKKFCPTRATVEKRMEPIALYAPKLYREAVLPVLDEYTEKGIIRK